MNDKDDARVIGLLRRVIRDCGKLYNHCGQWMVRRYPTLIEGNPNQFVELMDDLHRGLLIKVYVTIVRADDRWTSAEKRVAAAMIDHLWGEQLQGGQLREAATGLFKQADQLTWESLVAPFVRYAPLADSKAQVETIVMRLANLVAKCDGQTMPEESVALHTLQRDIDMALHPANPKSTLAPIGTASSEGPSAMAYQHQQHPGGAETNKAAEPESPAERERRLQAAMKELESLIGLQGVKDRVRSYANFLRLQQQRKDAGLATMPISLHMAFIGNPGTGKTTVARIVGQILGALGTLSSGHVIETDRSGLVAQYAGQTAVKTNELCDSAKGGVLFIDEAYSLVDASGDDAYGREAIQTLLKRMEDDRESMAVILAGYSDEMDKMIRSNPGLSSRINTKIDFQDYTPSDLGRIFEGMCEQNQYQMPSEARHRLLIGFQHLYECRDRHFGNGRLVRNAFEDTIRRLADRIAEVSELTESLLTVLLASDVSVPGVTGSKLDALVAKPHVLRIQCNGCQRKVRIMPESLGIRVRCKKCEHIQLADWAEVSAK
ncbi:AAA ATPase central domain protein [Rhodopirellula maiorica SM1]|uniref:AAA ATPase central domain protein n=1 Tax=Rhodopirellula maiorica SM1 TaxID=1265738 RepID=M5RJW6_9BACT|nr:AAA family ATPase [Rhodopirellula maiorica]EMI19600.1 AAA ATPase central domain protein [Rhodopirellula maiorica SM1]